MDYARIRTDLLALGLLALGVFVGLSLIGYDPADPPAQIVYPPRDAPANPCGAVGAVLAHALRSAFGVGAWFVFLCLVSLDVRLFSHREPENRALRGAGWLLSASALCVGLRLLAGSAGSGPVVGSGGYLGALGLAMLEPHLSLAGTLILVGCAFAAGLMLSGDLSFFQRMLWWTLWPVRLVARPLRTPASAREAETAGPSNVIRQPGIRGSSRTAHSDEPWQAAVADWEEAVNEEAEPIEQDETAAAADDAAAGDDDDPEADEPPSRAHRPLKINPPAATGGGGSDRDEIMARLEAGSRDAADEEFELPAFDLLEEAEDFPYELLARKAQVAAEVLERTFQEFGLNVRVSEVDTGPVITQFELELEKGLRLSKVTALADDLAIALRVPSVRVVAPIPGKNTVGVEVPNEKQVMVRLRELLESCAAEIDRMRIPIFLGKDVSGRPLAVDLTKMPHLLIAGRTGTGKSVCLNALILSILMSRSPEEVRMLMIDPKMVELSPYKRVPHLMHPVITDMKKAEAVLAWAVDKMEERYDLLARVGVRHLDGYNKLGKEEVLDRLGVGPDSDEADEIPERMPYIVIVADEMADMMMTSGKDVEGHIIRLAQKSRAVGIHLVLATQKPTVDVITGLIKSNLPARIAFQVSSKSDSRVVLDEGGADKLLGNGDMLYLAPGTSNLTRAQGTYVSDEEIENVIEFFGDHEPQYSEELARVSASASGRSGGPETERERDDLYEQAVEVVIRENLGSVSRLQRFLGIGYGRAARLIDWMAEDGIVGDYNGSKAREVLYTWDEWQTVQSQRERETVGV
ncbi:MAG: DNA translocase FtsK 4TM domain-containing protein [Planctomycetales bacterium]